MTKTILFCIIAPAFGASAVAVTLVAAMWVGQGLWGMFFMGGI
jgi:hypothetical protein